MKVESSIKENYSTVASTPITDSEECIKAICEWNAISIDSFKQTVGQYKMIGTDANNNYIYCLGTEIVNPIGMYLLRAYDNKNVVFEKGNDKFFGTLQVRAEQTRYALGDKVIDIPYRIKAVNEDTGESIIIFPKISDIVQGWMRGLYVIAPGWAERQRIEKEIVSKLIELAQIRSGNEIISTQNCISELQANLKKSNIDLELINGKLILNFPRRKIRDTARVDDEYIAPPIKVQIDFDNREIKCKGYSSHGFGTPNSWGNPCWGNRENNVRSCIQDCDIKTLINLVVSWSYGYNSDDIGTEHDGRHPVQKLWDYVWYLHDYQSSTDVKPEIEKLKQHLEEVKHDLNVDGALDGCTTIREFISSLESDDASE